MNCRASEMSKRILLVLVASAAIWGAGAQTPSTVPQRVSATVDASKAGEPITKYIYGQFIEHTRDLINRSIWAEMLDDRKFFYDVDSKPEDSASPGIRRCPRGRRRSGITGGPSAR